MFKKIIPIIIAVVLVLILSSAALGYFFFREIVFDYTIIEGPKSVEFYSDEACTTLLVDPLHRGNIERGTSWVTSFWVKNTSGEVIALSHIDVLGPYDSVSPTEMTILNPSDIQVYTISVIIPPDAVGAFQSCSIRFEEQ